MKIFWFLPTSGDGRYLATKKSARTVDFAYLRQVAQAVDSLGYYGALVPTGRPYEDTWLVSSSLMSSTSRMRFIVAVRPGLMSPTLSARMAATFDRLSNGRLILNVVTSGDPVENAGDGIFLGHDQRYDLADEFLTIWRRLAVGNEVNFEGKYLKVREARLLLPFVQRPYPQLYLGGSSPAALRLTAKHIDTYLTWGEPVEQVAEKVQAVRALAAEAGRSVRLGIRFHVIVRETEQEAWQAADQLIRFVDDATVAAAQAIKERTESVGQKRMTALHGGRREALKIAPNLWAGVGLVRGGNGTALVGDPQNLAKRIREYQEVGIEEFVFSGYPHLEEASRVAELLFPLLKPELPAAPSQSDAVQASGEVIAHNLYASAPATC